MEITTYLRRHRVSYAGVLETRVKHSNANKIRKVFGNNWKWMDNYEARVNGRIWFGWNPTVMDVDRVDSSAQYIHYRVLDTQGTFQHWLTIIYAHNQLPLRKILWNKIHNYDQKEPWIILGDFNNVMRMGDKIGGHPVQSYEYNDLEYMMSNIDLFEHDNLGNKILGQTNITKG